MDQKCTYEKVPKDLGRPPFPPHLDRIQKNSSFFVSPSRTTIRKQNENAFFEAYYLH